MMQTRHWIPYPTRLNSEAVSLLPLEREHFPDLISLANDKRIWEFYPFDGSNEKRMEEVLTSTIAARENGNQFPFVIQHHDGNIIGNTRLMDIQQQHRKLEIGGTWLHPDYWGTVINLECKLLLLSFCFETLGAYRVQLRTDENNIRSRKAIEKIGGVFEGILRNDMVRDNGSHRNSAYFSILSQEWPTAKAMLEGKINKDFRK